jgi:serine/threonine protein kinase/tetratricopeptide (TPR) repeat protein
MGPSPRTAPCAFARHVDNLLGGKMIGQTISHYKILEKLGEGGMGVVYKAEDTKLKRTVALKFLSPQALGTEDEKARFIHEAQSAAALNHPNICTVYEIDEREGQPFIAMEYIEGQSLKGIIASGPLKLGEAQNIAVQIAEGLHEAHRRNIVHRDIKPANIMITHAGRVKIMDFGLAKSPDRSKLTREGTTVGTVAYMSPEQTRGEEVDHRTDFWSLGVVLYEMISGQSPFKGDHEQAIVYSIVNEEPKPLTHLRTAVPVELERIARKAMAKSPRDRYQHADELMVDLRSLTVEIDSAGVTTGPAKKGFTRKRRGLVFGAVVIIAIALVLARLYLIPEKSKVIDSLAVLPLENLSGDPGQEYFADGMTEELIADLAKMGTLKVISRTSVMRYKETRKSVPEIARELDVDAILEGSVLQISGRVRITTQLIDAASDRHLWAESYERDLRDVLALQSDVARAIAREINLKLAPGEEGGLSSARQVDPQAYEAYLKGRYHWNKRTEQGIGKGIEYFEEAVRIDPAYAQAYAAIAEAFISLGDWGYYPPREIQEKTKDYAQKALAIDDESAAAYSALGRVSRDIDFNWEVAEEYFKKAILLNPNYETAHQWYSAFLSSSGRHDEAIEQAKRAVQLDPLSLVINQTLGFAYYYARRYDEAIEQGRKTLELDKNFGSMYQVIYLCYAAKGMTPEGVEAFKQAMSLDERTKIYVDDIDDAYNTSGYEGMVKWIIENMEEWTFAVYNRPFFYAMAYASIDDKDRAFEWLERAYELRSYFVTTIGVEPALDNLRSDPRFGELLKKIGLES